MLAKLKGGVKTHKRSLIVMLVVLLVVIGAGLALHAKHESDQKKAQEAQEARNSPQRQIAERLKTTYNFASANVSCKDVPATPKGGTTIKVCDGTVTLTNNNTHKNADYTVSSSTYLYKNGVPLTLDQFSSLPAGQKFTIVTFTGKDNKTLGNVSYTQ
ncbi:MAG TPA: hypothetical protein VF401_03480 [Candidatus Saccharimonadales bacterium]